MDQNREMVKVKGSVDAATCARCEHAGCGEQPARADDKGKVWQGRAGLGGAGHSLRN